MCKKNPITVLMGVYNEPIDILEKSILSILAQTFTEFIFLIIVDNPTNYLAIDLLKKYEKIDKRIICKVNEKNEGLPVTLNRGIDLVESKYIARMDADDIAHPNRLEIQYNYMEKHPKVDLVGCYTEYIDSRGISLYGCRVTPTKASQIRKSMRYINVMNHPTFFGLASVFKQVKYKNLKYAQDYEFVCRLITLGYVVENIGEILLKSRISENINLEKSIRQNITKQCVQECYRAGTLTSVNIERMVEQTYDSINIEQYKHEFKTWLTMIYSVKEKKYFSAIYNFLKVIKKCKFLRHDIYSTIIYVFLRKWYRI